MNNNFDPTGVPQPFDDVPSNPVVPEIPSAAMPEIPSAPAPEAPVTPSVPVIPSAENISAPSEPAVSIPVENEPAVPTQEMVSTPENPQIQNVQAANPQVENIQDKLQEARNERQLQETNNDLLLLAYIGKNCEKITTKTFNFAGFFFSWCYLFYRKMLGLGLLFFIGNALLFSVINLPAGSIGVNLLVGFLVNKLYVNRAKKQVNIIRQLNPDKDMDELKYICSKKGGTSVGIVFLGIFLEIIISIVLAVILLIFGMGGAIAQYVKLGNFGFDTETEIPKVEEITGDRTLLENITIDGYSCWGDSCTLTIGNEEYPVATDNGTLLVAISRNYSDSIKVNVYVAKKSGKKYIVDTKFFNKATNEEYTDLKTEDDLIEKLGLYKLGTHTDTFTLNGIGTQGFGFSGDNGYTYIPLTLVNSKNIKLEMNYINPDRNVSLVIGKKYEVTFDCVEGTFDREYKITSIKQK